MTASLLGLVLMSSPLGAVQPPDSKSVLNDISIQQNLGAQLPLQLEFADEAGRRRPLSDYFGHRPVILNLVYFDCPMLCSLTMDGALRSFQQLRLSIGADFDVLTVSIVPSDTPVKARAQRRALLDRYQRDEAAGGWHFLTGDSEAIEALTEAVGFRFVYDPVSGEFAHAAALIVLTPEGVASRYLYGVEYARRDLRLALVEASESRVGSAIDQLLLYCYQYDPATGRYTLAIMTLLRAGGALTLIGIGGLLFVLLRRERRPASSGMEVSNG